MTSLLRSQPTVDPRVLAAASRGLIAGSDSFRDALLVLCGEHRVTAEVEPGTGRSVVTSGEELRGVARVWTPEGSRRAVGRIQELSDALPLVARARQSAPFAASVRPPRVVATSSELGAAAAAEPGRALERVGTLVRQVLADPRLTFQAALVHELARWSLLLNAEHEPRLSWHPSTQLYMRAETARGAIVDAIGSPALDDALSIEPLVQRFADAALTLAEAGRPLDAALPVLFRPQVAAPAVAALARLLQGDVAVASPGLLRAVGKKLFPSVLSLRDDAFHPLGTTHRAFDDEGTPCGDVVPVSEGHLHGFLHASESAAAMGTTSNGRGFLDRERGALEIQPLNLHVAPRELKLPVDYNELSVRLETFTTSPRAGVVTLIAGGWIVREGVRTERIAPTEFEFPVLGAFRALCGVSSDLQFFPAHGGVGTPSLLFESAAVVSAVA